MIRRPPKSPLFPYPTLSRSTVSADEGIRADTTYEGVSKIRPAIEGGCIAAGNASQFSDGDRKSTRLNSSHSQISYAVFCLKKKMLTGTATAVFAATPPRTRT